LSIRKTLSFEKLSTKLELFSILAKMEFIPRNMEINTRKSKTIEDEKRDNFIFFKKLRILLAYIPYEQSKIFKKMTFINV